LCKNGVEKLKVQRIDQTPTLVDHIGIMYLRDPFYLNEIVGNPIQRARHLELAHQVAIQAIKTLRIELPQNTTLDT
jgi:hypothetical protein